MERKNNFYIFDRSETELIQNRLLVQRAELKKNWMFSYKYKKIILFDEMKTSTWSLQLQVLNPLPIFHDDILTFDARFL